MEISFVVQLDPAAAFDAILDELRLALNRLCIEWEPGPHGRLLQNGVAAGSIVLWKLPSEIAIEWMRASWQSPDSPRLHIRFKPASGGTRITLEQAHLSEPGDADPQESAGWLAGQLLAPAIAAMTPDGLADWLTDRRARHPSGPQARTSYRDPIYHRPNFLAILQVLQLSPDDFLVEIGCGGGAFLHDALRSGCRAAAIDHSADMVRTASELNRDSILGGRLEIRQADAGSLPFPDGVFTCAVTTGVFGFLNDPGLALAEIRRVLVPGGRLILFTTSRALLGTPAIPEPMAARIHFYEDDELVNLVHAAGFSEARVDHPDFEGFARQVGVPEDAISLFSNSEAGQLLLAEK